MAEPLQPETSDQERSDLPSLVVQFGSTRRKDRPLTKITTIIGRSRACDVTLDAPDVAAMHCLITRTPGGELYVRDCQSRSGTLLNEQPIREALARDGDTLQVGPFTFAVRVPEPVDAAEAGLSESPQTATTAATSAAQSEEIDRLREQLLEQGRRLEQELAESGLKRTELDQGFEDLARERDRLRSEAEEIRQRQAEADELAKSRRELERWQRRLEEKEAALAVAPDSLEESLRLQIEAEARAKMRAEIEAGELSVLNSEIDRLAKVIENTDAERDSQAERIRQLEAELLQRENLLAEATATQAEADDSERILDLNAQVETLSERLSGISAERDELKRQVSTRIKEAGIEAIGDPETTAENERLKRELQLAEEKIRDFENRFQRVDQESDRKLASMRAELDDERRRTKELVKEAAADYERTRLEIQSLKERLAAVDDPGEAQGSPELEAEVQSLRATVANLQAELDARPKVPSDLQEYEDQLNEFRAGLEDAQQQLETQEAELKDRVRQTEMQMSKDRANLARQLSDLERLRTEFRVELEHAEREAQVHSKLAPIQRLQDEMRESTAAASEGGTPLAERIRNILKRI